jgi:hypothetical protein
MCSSPKLPPAPPSADEALAEREKDKTEAAEKTRVAPALAQGRTSLLSSTGYEGVASSANPKSLF